MRTAAAAGPMRWATRVRLTKYAENNLEMLKNAGVKTVVTACSDCY